MFYYYATLEDRRRRLHWPLLRPGDSFIKVKTNCLFVCQVVHDFEISISRTFWNRTSLNKYNSYLYPLFSPGHAQARGPKTVCETTKVLSHPNRVVCYEQAVCYLRALNQWNSLQEFTTKSSFQLVFNLKQFYLIFVTNNSHNCMYVIAIMKNVKVKYKMKS